MNSTDLRIADLLLQWEESCEQGQPLTVEELCRDCPELIDDVRRKVRALEALAPVLGQEPAADHDTRGEQTALGRARTRADLPTAPTSDSRLPAIPGYELVRELGRGGMGVVYEARQPALAQRTVALKMLLSGPYASLDQRLRFKAEVEAVARLQHPNIVQIYEVGEVDGHPYCALEYVDGGNLADMLEGQPQSPRPTAELVATLADAVHAAHARGIVHRDIKPANVLLQKKTEITSQAPEATAAHSSVAYVLATVYSPKIADFGLAKDVGRATMTQTGAVMGTPSYMPPEQAAGQSHRMGPAVDIYALGAILYEMLTGRPPILGATTLETLNQIMYLEPVAPSHLQPNVPRDLETICLKCLQKEPRKRYATAADLAEDLRRYLRGEPIRARPVPPWERAWKWARRRPATAALAGVSAAAAVTLVVLGLVHNAQLRAERREADYQRAEAEANFQLARRVVDEYTEKLSDEEHAEDLRRELLQSSLAYYQQFVQQRADDPALRSAQGRAYLRLAQISSELGDKETKAIPLGQQAVAIFEPLHREVPDNAAYQRDLAAAHYGLGRTYRDLGAFASAEDALQKALTLQTALRKRDPKAVDYQRDLARTYFALGTTCFAHQCGRQRVEESYRKALALLEALPRPRAAVDDDSIGDVYFSLGSLHRAHGENEQAREEYRKALVVEKQLVRDHPGVANYASDLAKCYFGLATIDEVQGKQQEARDGYEKARDLREQLVHAHPSTTQFAVDLGNSYRTLGNVSSTPQTRYDWYSKAIDTLGAVWRKEPKHQEARQHLGDAYLGRGRALNGLGRPMNALADWQHAAELGRRKERLYQLGLAESFARLGRHAEADAEVAMLRELKLTPEQTLDLARVYALCARAATTNEKLAQDYAGRAVAVLEQAQAAGLLPFTEGLARLQKDDDFAAVRDLPAFKKLLAPP